MKIQIAENIKRFRMARGFTQNDLAVLLSVSTQAVSRWENGQAFPDITSLPLLAKYLDVSIDELMGLKGQQNKSLEKELYERKHAIIDDESEKIQNELRILDIYEELGHTELFHLCNYFQHLMCAKSQAILNIKILEDKIVNARQMIRNRLSKSSMNERILLLSTIASYEDEDKLEFWADEYELPEYIKTNFWEELLLSRYAREKSIDKLSSQNQKILYEHIKNTVYYLTDSVSIDMLEQGKEFRDLQRYRTALDTLELYSKQVDDIFIFTRIIAEVRYAEALLINERAEESLEMFSLATDHLLMLYRLSDGTVLHGSVSVLNTVHIVISADDKFIKCLMNIGGYDKNPKFDKIRDDKRFTDYMKSLEIFSPQHKCRSWVSENGNDTLDAQWEMLLNRAKKEADKLSDGEVVVMLTDKGAVASIPFKDLKSACDADGIMKALVEIKKNADAKIERIICMWHDGSIDFPSFAFREALLDIDSANFSTKLLLNGLTGYIVKTVRASMPKGYKA